MKPKSFFAVLVAVALAPVAVACTGSVSDDEGDGDEVSEAEAISAGVEPGSFKLYPEPQATPNPSCDIHTRLELKNDRGARARIEEAVGGFCEIAVFPNPRDYRLRFAGTSCGSRIYKGSVRKDGKRYSVEIVDHRTRTCRDVQRARLVVTETVPGEPGPITTTKYSYDQELAGEEKTVDGTLARVMGIGGESTGFAVLTGQGSYELILDDNEVSQFADGKKARVRGKLTFLSGVETHNRPALDVTSMLLCPSSRYVNCMPGPNRRLSSMCGPDKSWVQDNCPGVSFTH